MRKALLLFIVSASLFCLAGGNALAVPMSQLDFNKDYWTLTDFTTGQDGESSFRISIENASYESSFGLYTVDDTGNPTSILSTFEVISKLEEPSVYSFPTSVFFKNESGNWFVSLDENFTTQQSFSSSFGFYFDVYTGGINDPDVDYTWYTDINFNEDGQEHIGTQSQNPNVLIYLDDQYGGGDRDFNDMVVAGTDVAPVPEPATMLLLGTGLLGMGLGRRKFIKK